MIITIIIFIGVLAVLVLAHEWGHFMAARKLGIAVDEFGFGFPPRLASIRRGPTLYSLNWLPLGGFVKLKGEGGEAAGEADSYATQAAWKRAVVLVAGVAMNVVTAWVLLSLTLGLGIPTALGDAELAQARDVSVQVVGVAPGSPAAVAGIEVGDIIGATDGQPILRIVGLQDYLGTKANTPVQITVVRGTERRNILVAPTVLAGSAGRPAIGVNLVHSGTLRYPWHQAFWYGARDTVRLGSEIVKAFGGLLGNLVTRGTVPQDIAGPVGIAVLTGQVADLGFIYLLQFVALLSLNLAIINILPFPALDGGRLLFVVIEKLLRRPVNQRLESITHQIGFTLLMVLVLVITYRDVARLSGGFFSNLAKFLGT